MEVSVEIELEDVLCSVDMEEVINYYGEDRIIEHLQCIPKEEGAKPMLLELVRRRTNRFPDKETVKEVILGIIEDLWI